MAELGPVYMILGSDRPKVARALSRLRAHFSDEAVEEFDLSLTPLDDVLASCQMPGLFADRKLVVVVGADNLKAAEIDPLITYVGNPDPTAVLALVCDSLPSNSRLRKACAKEPSQLLEFSAPERKQLAGWVRDAFATHGAKVGAGAAQRLVEIVGDDSILRLDSEAAKIAAFARSEPVTVEMVEQLAVPSRETVVWTFSDAWADRDAGKLLAVAEDLMRQGEHPIRLVGLLSRHIQKVHQARRLLNDHSSGEVASLLGGNAWAAKKCVAQAERLSMPQADAALARIILLEHQLKGAAPLSSRNATAVFEQGLCELV